MIKINTFLLIILFLVLSFGLYMLFCSAAHLPPLTNTAAIMHLIQNSGKEKRTLDTVVFELSAGLSKFIKLSKSHRAALKQTLSSADITLTPEAYIARIAVRFIFRLIPGILAFVVTPVAFVIVLLWDVYKLVGDFQQANKKVKCRRDKIEADLPRLAADISQELKGSRDVIGILSSYKPSACKEFKDELDVTLADMRSGPPERALTRMDMRVGSTMLGEIVRGLQMVLHGDNGIMYFQMLEHDFKNEELEKLNLTTIKRPGKIQFSSFCIFACAVITIFVILLSFTYMKAKSFI